jgi:hypothetical protein
MSFVIEVQSDKSAGLLKITFSEKVTARDAEQMMSKAFAALDDLQPGFRLLADLSTLESMDVACAPFIGKVMDRCNDRGIKKVIRVIPDPSKDIGLKIMSAFHYDRHVRILTFDSLAEAQEALRRDSAGDRAPAHKQ